MADRTSASSVTKPPRREEILGVATELFAEKDYHAVGMRAIAETVGVRSSSLYHYFPAKQDLLAAITSEYTQSFISAHLPILEERDEPPDERLRTVLRSQIIYFWRHRLKRMVGLRELRTLADTCPSVYESVLDSLRRYQHAIERAVAEGVKLGTFDIDDPKVAALAVTGLTNSVNDWFNLDGPLGIEEVADSYANFAVDRLLRNNR